MSRRPTHTDVEFVRFPHLPGVELRRSAYRENVFRAHTHTTWSVGFIDSGSTTFTLTRRMYRARAGDMVVIGPGCPHACNPTAGQSITYVMFYLAREWFAPESAAAGYPRFPEPVLTDAPLLAQWRALGDAFAADPANADADALRSAVAALVERHAIPDGSPLTPRDLDAVEAAKRILGQHLAQKIDITTLAAATGLSRSHLSRAFTAREGLPPHTYQNQLRVERAKELIGAGCTFAETAAAAGFSDQAHFTRVFREFTGATPSQYRAVSP